MVGLLGNLKLIISGGGLVIIVWLGLAVLYYKGESDKLRDKVEALNAKNKELTYQIENLSKECNTTIKALQESCSERLKIERERAQKQLRACQKLLERRQRLEDKLRDIDRL